MNRGDVVIVDWPYSDLSGLKHLCYASCKDLLTREQALVHYSLGVLSDAVMRQIDASLKTVLEIP